MSTEKIRKNSVHTGEIKIHPDVDLNINENIVNVSGPLGNTSKDFSKIPIIFEKKDDSINFKILKRGKQGNSLIRTIQSSFNNLFIGVTKGYTYKMKIYYEHFPLSLSASNGKIILKNFGGERGLRETNIIGDVKIKTEGEDVYVSGLSKDDVGLTVGNIRKICKIKSKDPRVFLDGIYLYLKEESTS